MGFPSQHRVYGCQDERVGGLSRGEAPGSTKRRVHGSGWGCACGLPARTIGVCGAEAPGGGGRGVPTPLCSLQAPLGSPHCVPHSKGMDGRLKPRGRDGGMRGTRLLWTLGASARGRAPGHLVPTSLQRGPDIHITGARTPVPGPTSRKQEPHRVLPRLAQEQPSSRGQCQPRAARGPDRCTQPGREGGRRQGWRTLAPQDQKHAGSRDKVFTLQPFL